MATEQQLQNTQEDAQQDMLNIKDLLILCLGKWHWFLASMIVCMGFAVWYLLTTQPVYTRTAAILIKDDSKGSSAGNLDGFSDLGLFTTNSNVNNEMATLQSPDLMREVVNRLHLDMNYLVDGRFHKNVIYGTQLPVTANLISLDENESASFDIELKDGEFTLSEMKRNRDTFDDEVKCMLNDTVECGLGKVILSPTATFNPDTTMTIHVSRMPIHQSIDIYSGKLGVSRNDDKANVITLTCNDVSISRAEDLLNAVIIVYNESWVEDKNQVAVSTSMFINERLGVIEGELGNVDSDISSYQSEHLLPDVQAAANMSMNQASAANATIRELNVQVNMARYIRNYLSDSKNKNQMLPANSGLESSSISTQITAYNNMQIERNNLVSYSSTKNPLVVEMDNSLTELRKALVTSIDNEIVSLNAQIKSLKSFSDQAKSQIASNPKQAKYLLSVERQQKVKESLYLYLLQKREENELSQAFTAYNTRIVTMPYGSMIPTAPVKNKILLVAFVIALLLPVGIIYLIEITNTKIRGRKDLEALNLPYVGEIPSAYDKPKNPFSRKPKMDEKSTRVVVKEKSRNVVNEAFRVVRTNLEFMVDHDNKSHVIMNTSANPGSGKTFISYNLAMCFAIKGKKVIVVDLDLRRFSLSEYVNVPKTGIADYLVGAVSNVNDIIVKDSGVAGLDVIPVGTVPPNPTELLFSDRLETLLNKLREQYEYVFLDCPPIEIVADASIIAKHVDSTLFVVRAGLFDRSMVPELQKLYNNKKYNKLSLLLNGTEQGGHYGYKYGYNYGYSYGEHGYAGYSKEE